MWKGISKFLFLSLTVSRIRGHLAWDGTNNLHPVQGLYVRPSSDGTTGDLYVAATEDHGVEAHWLTDQPINFLPAAAATVTQPTTVPVSFSSSFSKSSSPHEETVTTQKRAVITSPPVKYAFALPSEGGSITPYPYFAIPTSTSDGSNSQCSTDGASALSYPPFAPYHYYYPQMMSAITNAMTALNDENASTASKTPSFWPQAYTYPYQYIMVDPAAWTQGQASTSTPATSTSNENA